MIKPREQVLVVTDAPASEWGIFREPDQAFLAKSVRSIRSRRKPIGGPIS